MSKKGAPKTPPPVPYQSYSEYEQPHIRAKRERERAQLDETLKRLAEQARRREQERQRQWRIYWWACAAAAASLYWVWWLVMVFGEEPVTWTWRG